MAKVGSANPYLVRIKDWKIRNMVMLYLDAREKFLTYRRMLKKGIFISFEKMREICDILYEIKEDHHLIFKRLVDPQKNRFERAPKFTPSKVETEFMNNIGLLFHKVMVTRELKYLMEHYIEESEAFQKSEENLQYHLSKINALFGEGIEILKNLVVLHKDNILLVTLLLEDPARTKKHFGQDAYEMLEKFANGKGLEEVYFSVGSYYARNGWSDNARKMLEEALRRNPKHLSALELLNTIDE